MKHNSYIVKRNRSICNLFWTLYRAGTPTMRAYAELADKFDLTEESIRKIVAPQRKLAKQLMVIFRMHNSR